MLTCTFNDGDTWLLLWLFASVLVAIVGLLLLHIRTGNCNSRFCYSK
ncbi:E5delta [Pan paniscus papillomavirus 1]|nr:E5delta [Pan paniscus papillomavirus 1]